MCAACRAQPDFERFADTQLGLRNAPATPELREMYRRLFVAGWRASERVSWRTHLRRALGYRDDFDPDR